MECPVCHHKNVPSGARECPNCHSDLESFRLIQDLEKSCHNRRTVNYILGIIAVILLLLWIGSIFYLDNKYAGIEEEAEAAKAQVEQLIAEKQTLVKENEGLQQQVTQLELTLKQREPKPQVTRHIVQAGETLFLIAEKYYGNGYQFNKIVCDNQLDDPDFIVEGQVLYLYGFP
ncbi:MAG: LysM peptidoglycan-binding domain-containing protein [Bacteroidota bacterium]|nr:LysM peptidoglycan-binding domain-containing protein [Bacteroidota bacterium]